MKLGFPGVTATRSKDAIVLQSEHHLDILASAVATLSIAT